MAELVLVKIPVHIHETPSHPTVDAERVIGVHCDQTPTVLEYDYEIDGTETEEAVTLPGSMPDRITDFFSRTIALDPAVRPFYDCHLFTYFALGKALDIKEYNVLNLHDEFPISNTALLEPGEVYGMIGSNEMIAHSVLGIDRPTHNLSIIGETMPMIIGSTTEMLRLYGAVGMSHMLLDRAFG